MRQAINNLQSTVSGFSFVNAENVFKVCDQPHPAKITKLIDFCIRGQVEDALDVLNDVWIKGYR